MKISNIFVIRHFPQSQYWLDIEQYLTQHYQITYLDIIESVSNTHQSIWNTILSKNLSNVLILENNLTPTEDFNTNHFTILDQFNTNYDIIILSNYSKLIMDNQTLPIHKPYPPISLNAYLISTTGAQKLSQSNIANLSDLNLYVLQNYLFCNSFDFGYHHPITSLIIPTLPYHQYNILSMPIYLSITIIIMMILSLIFGKISETLLTFYLYTLLIIFILETIIKNDDPSQMGQLLVEYLCILAFGYIGLLTN